MVLRDMATVSLLGEELEAVLESQDDIVETHSQHRRNSGWVSQCYYSTEEQETEHISLVSHTQEESGRLSSIHRREVKGRPTYV